MPPASETRIPVAVLNVFQLLCPLAIFFAAATGAPANEVNTEVGPANESIFRAYNADPRLLYCTIACTLLGLLQLAVIGDPARGAKVRKYGIACAALAVVVGLVVAHAGYRIGFAPAADYYETRPLAGSYVAMFGGIGFAVLAIMRLTRFFDPAPPVPAPTPTEAPGPPTP